MRYESVEKIRGLMTKALSIRHLSGREADLIIEDHLGAQMEGRFTHGVSKFLLIDTALAERQNPAIVRQTGSYALVNGNRELGQLAASFCIERLIEMTKNNGIALVGMFNASRYGRVGVFGSRLAHNGLIGIIANTGGPPAVAPFNGIDPILGTNPICFSFPTNDGGIFFDFSTSERVWGEIKYAMLTGKELPADAFIDADGSVTQDPSAVRAVLPFDGPKGYALCLAIEILAGALVTAKMGVSVKTQYDLGFLFIAIDPKIFTTLPQFQQDTSDLLESIRSSRGISTSARPRIPGEKSREDHRKAEMEDRLRIDEPVFERLLEMSQRLL